ncbi:MAG: hypothetical protein H7237_03730 [Alkalinema sp. FL-bin-369]|nr:hypothetical protein [Leptolyngbyaceae cyanobacterium LF-bin-369]
MNVGEGAIETPTGRTGTIGLEPFPLALYTFVHFDDGVFCWMLTEILKPLEAKVSKKKSKKA